MSILLVGLSFADLQEELVSRQEEETEQDASTGITNCQVRLVDDAFGSVSFEAPEDILINVLFAFGALECHFCRDLSFGHFAYELGQSVPVYLP